MVEFQQVSQSRLFQSTASQAQAGWWAVLLPVGVTAPGSTISLDDALSSAALNATFVYAAAAPDLSGNNATAFIESIQKILDGILETRALIFIEGFVAGPQPAIAGTPVVVGLRQTSTQVLVNTGVNVVLTGVKGIPQVQASMASGSSITSTGDALTFSNSSAPAMTIAWPGSTSDTFQPDNTSVLAFSGPTQGTFDFGIYIRRLALNTSLDMGFQLMIPNDHTGKDTAPTLQVMLPFADPNAPSSTDMIGFTGQINVVNPNNKLPASRTVMLFTGQNADGSSETNTTLASYYRTNSGKKITLLPVADDSEGQQQAGLTINPGYGSTPQQNGFRFAPAGDFAMRVEDATANEPEYLMCGLSGTETVAFLSRIEGAQAGSRIRFTLNQPANAPRYPVPASSPTGPPIDPSAMLLDDTYQTAWGNVIAAPGDSGTPLYSAAPKGSDLFGLDPVVAASEAGLLGPVNPGVALPVALTYPLLPMAGFVAGTGEQDMTGAELEGLERQILSPTRRNAITKAGAAHAPSAHRSLGVARANDQQCPFNSTTPTGFISHVRCDGTWDQLLLGQVTEDGAVTKQVGFTLLQADLQAAFQTSDLFLVVANAVYLGAPKDGTFMPPATNNITDQNLFFNTLSLVGWTFQANVGTESAYSDYRNVVIVKGVKGKLTELVLSPETWTMKDRFGAPTVKLGEGVSDPDVSQLIPLSNWLAEYFNESLSRADDPFFANFNAILEQADWTGVLMLRVDIQQVPADLAGITAGVNDPAAFYAHHIGIEISQINGAKVEQQDSSSIFGLVYYVDPNYTDSQTPHPIPPRSQDTYTFTLLTLKALFQNSALKKFDSLAQITLNQIFGSAVTAMGEGGNIYNAVLLTGAFQMNGDAPVYSLSSATANTYLLANNVLTQVEIDTAVMSTRDDGRESGTTVSWIAMSGYMNFAVIEGPAEQTTPLPPVDLFSFGSTTGEGAARTGLNFANLGLEIRSRTDGTDASVELIEREISFNTDASTARETSLFRNFQLQLQGMQSGDGETTPQSAGYVTVGTQYALQGVSGGNWHGLQFTVNLGTPGALAGKINLNSSLLCAWADDSGAAQGQSGYRALVAMLLPGAGGSGSDLFSLQTVIKLSVGVVQLYYNEDKQSFLLLMNEIALKFLGLLKIPPNGATAFFLFGGPQVSSPTGLGWYAIYNQDQPESSSTQSIAARR